MLGRALRLDRLGGRALRLHFQLYPCQGLSKRTIFGPPHLLSIQYITNYLTIFHQNYFYSIRIILGVGTVNNFWAELLRLGDRAPRLGQGAARCGNMSNFDQECISSIVQNSSLGNNNYLKNRNLMKLILILQKYSFKQLLIKLNLSCLEKLTVN